MKTLIFVLLIALFTSSGYPQSIGDQKQRVRLLVSDRIGLQIPELKAENVELTAGKERPIVTRLDSELNDPVAVAIILSENIFAEADEIMARRFIQRANAGNDYCVITSSGKADVLVDWKSSRQDLEAKLAVIAKTRAEKGNSVIFDAIAMGMSKLAESGLKRKVLLIFGHAYDLDSKTEFSAVKDMLQKSDVVAYGIKIDELSGSTMQPRDAKLEKLTEISGGMVHSLIGFVPRMKVDPPLPAGNSQIQIIDTRRPGESKMMIQEEWLNEIVERLVFQTQTTYLLEFSPVKSPDKLRIEVGYQDQEGKKRRFEAKFKRLSM